MKIAVLWKYVVPVFVFAMLAHSGIGSAFGKELRSSFQSREVKCFLKGDGTTTSSCDLVLLNNTDRVQKVEIEAFQVFVPTSTRTQTMMSTQSAVVTVEPGKAAVTQIPTVCISAKNVPPPADRVRAYLPTHTPDASIYKEIYLSASSLEASNGLDSLPLPQGKRMQTIAQLAIWREIGLTTPDKGDDVTRETIKTTIMESAHVDPSTLTKLQRKQLDDGVAAIFATVDLTRKNAHDTIAKQPGNNDVGKENALVVPKEGQPGEAARQAPAEQPGQGQPTGRGSGPYVLSGGTVDSDTTLDTGARIIVFKDQSGNTHEIQIDEDGHAVEHIKTPNSNIVAESEYDIHISADGSRTETESGNGCRRVIVYGPDGSELTDTWEERIGKGSEAGTELWRRSVRTIHSDGTHTREETTYEVPGSDGSTQSRKQSSSKPRRTNGSKGEDVVGAAGAQRQRQDESTVAPDGTRTYRYANGIVHIFRRNGIEIIANPDGTRITRRPSPSGDGSVDAQDTPPPEGRVGLSLPGNWWRTQDPDGTVIVTTPNCTEITRQPDGTLKVTRPDGSTVPLANGRDMTFRDPSGDIVLKPDGSIELHFQERIHTGYDVRPVGEVPVFRSVSRTMSIATDGTAVTHHEDGTTDTRHVDGTTVTRRPNGEEFTRNPDGTTSIRFADGTRIENRLDGTKVVTTPDGKVLTRGPNWDPADETGASAPPSEAQPSVSP